MPPYRVTLSERIVDRGLPDDREIWQDDPEYLEFRDALEVDRLLSENPWLRPYMQEQQDQRLHAEWRQAYEERIERRRVPTPPPPPEPRRVRVAPAARQTPYTLDELREADELIDWRRQHVIDVIRRHPDIAQQMIDVAMDPGDNRDDMYAQFVYEVMRFALDFPPEVPQSSRIVPDEWIRRILFGGPAFRDLFVHYPLDLQNAIYALTEASLSYLTRYHNQVRPPPVLIDLSPETEMFPEEYASPPRRRRLRRRYY